MNADRLDRMLTALANVLARRCDERKVNLDEFAARAKTDDAARRLASIPGIGVLNATALAAAVGNAASFARGRDLAAWLGPVRNRVWRVIR